MTVRNLMGQIDGTNPGPTDADFNAKIFVPDTSGPESWMNGGSYGVVRRIRMLLDSWDDLTACGGAATHGRRTAAAWTAGVTLVLLALLVSWAASERRVAARADRQALRDNDAALAACNAYLSRLAARARHG